VTKFCFNITLSFQLETIYSVFFFEQTDFPITIIGKCSSKKTCLLSSSVRSFYQRPEFTRLLQTRESPIPVIEVILYYCIAVTVCGTDVIAVMLSKCGDGEYVGFFGTISISPLASIRTA